MTTKERWLAALRMEPVDRLPFWPKLNGSYGQVQVAPFREMTIDALHDWIGSDKHMGIPGCVRAIRKRTAVETGRDGGIRRTVFRIPRRTLQLVEIYDGPSGSWHPIEFPVKSIEDIEVMTEIFEDVTVEPDRDALQQAQDRARQIGSAALTEESIGQSPLMHWVEWVAGIENAHLLLADHQQAVETLFEAMHEVLLERTRLLCESSPADTLYLYENTSTTLISPAQYRRYCARHVGAYAALTQAANRNLILHMCGHLKQLLPDLSRIPAQAFEAFTSPTLGDTRLFDGRAACPTTCLIGGTNAMLWLQEPAAIIARIEQDLDELPHQRGIVITSAGVMPPSCKPDTIRRVCEWVKRYPVR